MKRDLYFSTPYLNAAGTLGFMQSPKVLEAFGDFLGAFVTNPISLQARKPTSQPKVLDYPGGLLLHTGLPNPGFSATIKQNARHWRNSDVPVIVHLMADLPEETARMVERLETVENVMAVELGFAPLLSDEILLNTVEMCLGELPLVVSLAHTQALILGSQLVDAGATAISLAAPRGALAFSAGRLVEGRLYGPSLFPQSLEIVHSASKIGLPIIGAGGIYNKANTDAMLDAGALAVQLDTVIWRGGFEVELSES